LASAVTGPHFSTAQAFPRTLLRFRYAKPSRKIMYEASIAFIQKNSVTLAAPLWGKALGSQNRSDRFGLELCYLAASLQYQVDVFRELSDVEFLSRLFMTVKKQSLDRDTA